MSYRPPNRAVRALIKLFDDQNKAERRWVHPDEIRRSIRAQLQREQPNLSNEEIEKRIDRRMQHGMKPTSAKPMVPPAGDTPRKRSKRRRRR